MFGVASSGAARQAMPKPSEHAIAAATRMQRSILELSGCLGSRGAVALHRDGLADRADARKPMLLIEVTRGGGTDAGVGAAAGFDLFGAAGFGFHVTAEVSSLRRDEFPLLVGVGLHYMVGLGSVL